MTSRLFLPPEIPFCKHCKEPIYGKSCTMYSNEEGKSGFFFEVCSKCFVVWYSIDWPIKKIAEC